jgi:hypothetical protein
VRQATVRHEYPINLKLSLQNLVVLNELVKASGIPSVLTRNKQNNFRRKSNAVWRNVRTESKRWGALCAYFQFLKHQDQCRVNIHGLDTADDSVEHCVVGPSIVLKNRIARCSWSSGPPAISPNYHVHSNTALSSSLIKLQSSQVLLQSVPKGIF